jgi:hypothetical protein
LDGRPGLALVALSVVEQRCRAVMAVLNGAMVSEVAAEVGASRQSVHAVAARVESFAPNRTMGSSRLNVSADAPPGQARTAPSERRREGDELFKGGLRGTCHS